MPTDGLALSRVLHEAVDGRPPGPDLLTDVERRARGHRRRRRTGFAAGTVMAGALAGAGVLLFPSPGSSAHPAVTPSLGAAAAGASREATAKATDDRGMLASAQWWTVTDGGGNPATPGPEHPDTWSYERTGGVVQVRSTGNIRRPSPFWVGNRHETWQSLQSLPTTAAGMRAMFGHIPHRSVPSAMATTIGDLAQAPVPLEVRRAVEAVATELPGATVTDQTKDSRGRPAVHVLVADADYRGVVDEYFFDPVSARLLEMDVHPKSGFSTNSAQPSFRSTFRGWSTQAPKVGSTPLPVVPWVTPFPG